MPRRGQRPRLKSRRMRTPALYMAPLCGKLLTPEDRKVWTQAIALLLGLKTRNGFSDKDLAAAVGTALHRGAAKRSCEDCGVKVAGGATINSRGPQGGSVVPLGWRFLNSPGPHIYSCT